MNNQQLALVWTPALYSVWRIFSVLCLDFDDRFVHTRIIREYYVFLVDTVDAKHSGLVGELYQAEVLNAEERDTINSEVLSFTQNEKLLSMLSRKTNDQFDKFLDALDNTGQQHVRNHVTGRQGQLSVATVPGSGLDSTVHEEENSVCFVARVNKYCAGGQTTWHQCIDRSQVSPVSRLAALQH